TPAMDGEKARVLVMTADVTAQKMAERRKRDLDKEKEKNAVLAEFFSTISHDLKTPLTVLNTSMYLLERAQNQDQRERSLHKMKDNIELLEEYVQDMLMIARLDQLPQVEMEQVAVGQVMEQMIERLQVAAEKKQIRLQAQYPTNLPTIRANRDHLLRACINLVENALLYTPVGGSVLIHTQIENGALSLSVEDSGIGIPPEEVPHIFDRFYRGKEAKRIEHTGSGLGLAIVKRIVEIHKGSITVHSEEGQGTTFRISLPV
ncbi:MAG: HAMP domain-containing histidine kinase, partial [Anaerolineae bacterium]|nr:HAMP domain-containing histidine kinase [Anaerolineae bacterium]